MPATIQELAGEAARCFEVATRADGSTFTRVKDGSPEWVSELAREAHGRDGDGSPAMLPDDWRYKTTAAALEYIAELSEYAQPDEERFGFADQAVDVYTADRLEWLGSNLRRAGYCDDAVDELAGGESPDTIDRIGLGQYAEALEVIELVLEALEAQRDELEAAELFDDDEVSGL